jgi:chloramphenicol 3-O-phosphotransferase
MIKQLYVVVKAGLVVEETVRSTRQKALTAAVAQAGYYAIVTTALEREAWAKDCGFVVQRCVLSLCG